MTSGWIAALLVAAALGVAACTGGDNGGALGAPNRVAATLAPTGQLRGLVPPAVAAAGVLRVGADATRAPLLFYGTGTRQAEGIEYDLLLAMGRQLGLSIMIVDVPLAGLGTALLAGRIDAAASGYPDLKSSEASGVDFVDDLEGATAILVRPGDPAKVAGADDLCGRSVAVQAGSAQQVAVAGLDDACVARHRPPVSVRVVTGHDALLADVTGGQVQCAADDAVVGAYTAQGSTGAQQVQVVGVAVDPTPYGIGVARTNAQLRDALRAALQAAIADGEYDQALSRWGGNASALRTAAVDG